MNKPESSVILNSPKTLERMKKKAQGHLRARLNESAAAHKESVAKWNKDFPGRQPGYSLATWKTYSDQRINSPAYREGYAQIDWTS